jgi:hypothetical protein
VAAASGIVAYRNISWKPVFTAIDKRFRHLLAHRTAHLGEMFLYGVNMGIRRSTWERVRGQLCHERHFAEDLDLAAHLADMKEHVIFAPDMQAAIVPRQAASGPKEFFKYVWSGPRTYADHGLSAQRYMYPMAIFVLSVYIPILVLYRGYNPELQHFSFAHAWRPTVQARVSPVSELI